MGRKKFQIDTVMDSIYMYNYIQANEQKIKDEFYQDNIDSDAINSFDDRLWTLHDMFGQYGYAVHDDSMFRTIQTSLLYLLSQKRITKIRTTIRAKRMSMGVSKKQITIEIDVHEALKKYSQGNKQTLSDAIKSLLINYNAQAMCKAETGN